MTSAEQERAKVIGGLTKDEWIYVGRVIFRWPALGACSAQEQQVILAKINETIEQFDAIERGEHLAKTGQ